MLSDVELLTDEPTPGSRPLQTSSIVRAGRIVVDSCVSAYIAGVTRTTVMTRNCAPARTASACAAVRV
jgi:hypothetical protein